MNAINNQPILAIIYLLLSILLHPPADCKKLRFKNAHEIITQFNNTSFPKQKQVSNSDGTHSYFSDPFGTDCGRWTVRCVNVTGLESSANPEINDLYCVTHCDVHEYVMFQSQRDCSFTIRWIPSHYIIYSPTVVRTGTVSNHLFASAKECDIGPGIDGAEHLASCSLWTAFNLKDELVEEHNVSVIPMLDDGQDGTHYHDECTSHTSSSGINMANFHPDHGAVAAVVIAVLALFTIGFSGSMRYH